MDKVRIPIATIANVTHVESKLMLDTLASRALQSHSISI